MNKNSAALLTLLVFAISTQVLPVIMQVVVGYILITFDIPASERFVANAEAGIAISSMLLSFIIGWWSYKKMTSNKK